jgi:integrase
LLSVSARHHFKIGSDVDVALVLRLGVLDWRNQYANIKLTCHSRLPPRLEQGSYFRPMRRTKVSQNYKNTGNLGAVQILLGHTKMDSTARYLGHVD